MSIDPYKATELAPNYIQNSTPVPPPPPDWTPERHRKPWLAFALIAAITAVMSIAATMEGLSYATSHQEHVATRTPTTTNAAYTAMDILSNFEEDGCKCGYSATYATNILEWSGGNLPVGVEPDSSASWSDPGGETGAALIGLWIYHSAADTQTAYNQVAADKMSPNNTWAEYMGPAEFPHERCLLLITGYASADTPPPWSGYQQSLNKHCT